jgi:hypothetical protein
LEQEGLILWKRVRDELGASYQVYFHSAILHHTFSAPEDYQRALA